MCQQTKASYQKAVGLLQNLPIPKNVLEHVTIDFIEGFPRSEEVDTILFVVDRLTKFRHFSTLRHPFMALTMVELYVKKVVRLHGFPTSIISDRDKIFMSIFWRELFRLQHTHLLRNTMFHPQNDGQSEIVNKAIETYLCCFVNEQPKKGPSGYIELNSIITRLLISPRICLHFKPSMAGFHHISYGLGSSKCLLNPWISCYKRGI